VLRCACSTSLRHCWLISIKLWEPAALVEGLPVQPHVTPVAFASVCPSSTHQRAVTVSSDGLARVRRSRLPSPPLASRGVRHTVHRVRRVVCRCGTCRLAASATRSRSVTARRRVWRSQPRALASLLPRSPVSWCWPHRGRDARRAHTHVARALTCTHTCLNCARLQPRTRTQTRALRVCSFAVQACKCGCCRRAR
jgi:hypothetical protein